MRFDTGASLISRKELGGLEKAAAKPASLNILSNSDAPKRAYIAGHIDTDNSHGHLAAPEHEWMMPRATVIRVVGIVGIARAAKLEEDTATYCVVGVPAREPLSEHEVLPACP